MANRFSIGGAPGPTKAEKEFRDREARLAERKADPGYQFLNAGLSTLASTLGNLAVNAASYELFGGRKRDDLAEDNLKLAQDQFSFNQKKFADELQLEQDKLSDKQRQDKMSTATSAIDSAGKVVSTRMHLLDPATRAAVMNKMSGPSEREIETQAKVKKFEDGSAYEVTDQAAADFSTPDKKFYKKLAEGETAPTSKKTESIDYFEGLDGDQRRDGQALYKQLTDLGMHIKNLPEGVDKDAVASSWAIRLNLSNQAADKLFKLSGTKGASVAVQPDSVTTKLAQRSTPSAVDWRHREDKAKSAKGAYDTWRAAMEEPNALWVEEMVPGFSKMTPSERAAELTRRDKQAKSTAKAARSATDERGHATMKPGQQAEYSPVGGAGKAEAAKDAAAKRAYRKQLNSNKEQKQRVFTDEFTNFVRTAAANNQTLPGMSADDLAILQDDESTFEEKRAVYTKFRGLLNSESQAALDKRLLDGAYATKLAGKKGPGAGGTRKAEKETVWERTGTERLGRSLDLKFASSGQNADKDIKKITKYFDKGLVTPEEMDKAIRDHKTTSLVLRYLETLPAVLRSKSQ